MGVEDQKTINPYRGETTPMQQDQAPSTDAVRVVDKLHRTP